MFSSQTLIKVVLHLVVYDNYDIFVQINLQNFKCCMHWKIKQLFQLLSPDHPRFNQWRCLSLSKWLWHYIIESTFRCGAIRIAHSKYHFTIAYHQNQVEVSQYDCLLIDTERATPFNQYNTLEQCKWRSLQWPHERIPKI